METYIDRDLGDEIQKYMKSKEIIAIVGTRRCGKTTLSEKIIENFKGKTKIISFDNVKILRLFETDIDAFINEHIKGYDLVFIDEIQYSKNSGKKLKYIYDLNWTKIIISGSSAAEISIHSLRYLVGRILIFRLFPFSFKEFIRAKEPKLEQYLELKKVSGIVLERLNKHLEEYITYGGYPQAVLEKEIEGKKKILEGIFNTYLLKEIKEILELSDNYKLVSLLKALSIQDGNIINYDELSRLSGFKYLELKKYLKILEETFILKRVMPFFTNKRTEIIKSPKVYFLDFGFRNIILDNFSRERADLGSIYENLVFIHFAYKNKELRFWNTKSNAEVDFIFEQEGKIIPLEVKLNLTKAKITRSFRSFIEKYKIKKGYFISRGFAGETKEKGAKIEFLPFAELGSAF